MKHKAGRICLIVLAIYLTLGAAFYFIAGESLRKTSDSTATVTPKALFGEFTQGQIIEQPFTCEYDSLTKLGLRIGTLARKNTDKIQLELLDEQKQLIYYTVLDAAQMKDNSEYVITLNKEGLDKDHPLNDANNRTFTMRMTSLEGALGKNAISFYYGNTVDTGRFSIAVEVPAATLDGAPLTDEDDVPACLCLTVYGTDYHIIGQYYWLFYAGGALLLGLYLLYLFLRYKNGKRSLLLSVAHSLTHYRFLIKQLVTRDFKTKYKRSVLGMLWSFLNPLLTMGIQFVVFSTLFQSDIDNFIVYLLTGIVCFNFFSEATNMCLMSIIGNATLINKVYVPKYIYPFSRTLSSSINLLLSLVPLLFMLIVTGTKITPAILLLPFVLVMLFLLSYGIGLILAAMMVFFRDTQFLWGICVMLLNYLTPIFYPETIIPVNILPIYRLNPLYQVISFMRTILMEGVSPAPLEYLTCILACLIPFLIGLLIFKKNEDKFVLNI